MENHLKTRHGVVAEGAKDQEPVLVGELVDGHVIVENDRPRRFYVALDSGALQEDHLRVVKAVRTHLELAALK